MKRKLRAACVGGCGTMVKRDSPECRKCRRARLHAGLKKTKTRIEYSAPRAETAKEKYDRVKS